MKINSFHPSPNVIKAKRLYTSNINHNTDYKFFEGDRKFFTITLPNIDKIENFTKIVHNHMLTDETYFVLIKLRYDNDKYMMLGKQRIFKFDFPYHDSVRDFRIDIINLLSTRLEQYNLEMEQIMYVNVIYTKIDKRFISDLKIDKSNLNNKDLKIIDKNIKYFPVTSEASVIGDEITDITYNEKGLVEKLIIPANYNFDFMVKLKQNKQYFNNKTVKDYKPIEFNRSYRFFFRNINKAPYLLVIRYIADCVIKYAYSLNANFLGSVTDVTVDNTVYRTQGPVQYTIIDGNIIERSVSKVLPTIKRSNIIGNKFDDNKGSMFSDPRIAVIDLETYIIPEQQVSKVYAAGVKRNGYPAVMFYIDKKNLRL